VFPSNSSTSTASFLVTDLKRERKRERETAREKENNLLLQWPAAYSDGPLPVV
jgi:hypothetical protein